MKKVKKMRGGGHCDKANTKWRGVSNEITEETFIEDMNDKVKRDRFIELVSNGGYNHACLNNFIEIINSQVERLKADIEWAKGDKNADMLTLYSSSRIPKITMFAELKSTINNSLKKNVARENETEFSVDAVHSIGSDDFSGSKPEIGDKESSSNGQTRAVLGAPSSRVPDLLKRTPGKKKGGKSRKQKSKR
jgi:hypothetical protein